MSHEAHLTKLCEALRSLMPTLAYHFQDSSDHVAHCSGKQAQQFRELKTALNDAEAAMSRETAGGGIP